MHCTSCGRELFGTRRLCDACRSKFVNQPLIDDEELSLGTSASPASLHTSFDLASPMQQIQDQSANLFLRSLAAAFDLALLTVIFISVGVLVSELQNIAAEILVGPLAVYRGITHSSFWICFLDASIIWIYFVSYESSSLGASPGKRLFGLTVVNQQSRQLNSRRAIVRNFPKFLIPILGGLLLVYLEQSGPKVSTYQTQVLFGIIVFFIVAGAYMPLLWSRLRQSIVDSAAGAIVIRSQDLASSSVAVRTALTACFVGAVAAALLIPGSILSLIPRSDPQVIQGAVKVARQMQVTVKPQPTAKKAAPPKQKPIVKAKQKEAVKEPEKEAESARARVDRWFGSKDVQAAFETDGGESRALPVSPNWFKHSRLAKLPSIRAGTLGYLLWGKRKLVYRGAVAVFNPQEHTLDITLYESPVTESVLERSSPDSLPEAAPMRLRLRFRPGSDQASDYSLVSHSVIYNPRMAGLTAHTSSKGRISDTAALKKLPQIDSIKVSGLLDGDHASVALACVSKESKIGRTTVVFNLALAVPVSLASDVFAAVQ